MSSTMPSRRLMYIKDWSSKYGSNLRVELKTVYDTLESPRNVLLELFIQHWHCWFRLWQCPSLCRYWVADPNHQGQRVLRAVWQSSLCRIKISSWNPLQSRRLTPYFLRRSFTETPIRQYLLWQYWTSITRGVDIFTDLSLLHYQHSIFNSAVDDQTMDFDRQKLTQSVHTKMKSDIELMKWYS